MIYPIEREQALLAYFSSPRACERHAPLSVLHLSKVLQMPVWELYELSNHQGRHYHRVRLPKRHGDFRELHVPDEALRQVQRAVLHRILTAFPAAPCATAYHPGASLRGNAQPHVGKRLLLKLDIRDFFGSITYPLVRVSAFPSSFFPEPAAVMLSSLCTLDDVLPQGAPTSPAIANLVMREFDERLSAWCSDRAVCYTRYCDDMAFSGSFSPNEVLRTVRSELHLLGMQLNERKTTVIPSWKSQQVTGVTVNQRPRLPAASRRELRQTLYYCQKFGANSHLAHSNDKVYALSDGTWDTAAFLRSLLGRISFALQLDPQDEELRGYRQWLLQALSHSV